jgi:hypothetical protein
MKGIVHIHLPPTLVELIDLPPDKDSYDDAFSTLIKATADFEYKDPLDKVYGILGLVERRDFREILPTVDYSKSSQQLYLDVMRGLLTSDIAGEKVDYLGLSQNLQKTLLHPFWNEGTKSFDRPGPNYMLERYQVMLYLKDHIVQLGPVLCARRSEDGSAIEWIIWDDTELILGDPGPYLPSDPENRDLRELQQVIQLQFNENDSGSSTPTINSCSLSVLSLRTVGLYRHFKSRGGMAGLAPAAMSNGDVLCYSMVVLRRDSQLENEARKQLRTQDVVGRALFIH